MCVHILKVFLRKGYIFVLGGINFCHWERKGLPFVTDLILKK